MLNICIYNVLSPFLRIFIILYDSVVIKKFIL